MSKGETTAVDYDCPSWSHKQADQLGYKRALREILDILETSSDREQP